jgi:hypothetical protein
MKVAGGGQPAHDHEGVQRVAEIGAANNIMLSEGMPFWGAIVP